MKNYINSFRQFSMIYESEQNAAESVCVIVVNENNQILVLQRGPTAPWEPLKWNFPGGMMEGKDKDFEAAGKREVYEETDMKLDSIEFLKRIYDKEYNYYLNVYVGNVSGDFKIDLTKHPTIEDGKTIIECVDYKWVDVRNYSNLKYVPYTKELIEEYFKK